MATGAQLVGGDYVNTSNPTASTADNTVIYTSSDISRYNYHIFENTSGEVIDIFVSVDGTNFTTAAAAVRLIDDVTTGGGVDVISIAAAKTGILRGKFAKLRILMKGDAAADISIGDVRIAHGVE